MMQNICIALISHSYYWKA